MKKDWSHLDKYRHRDGFAASNNGDTFGSFQIMFNGRDLRIVATDGHDGTVDTHWEHVSVHAYDPIFRKDCIPKWDEMCFVKKLFWEDAECVVQFHVPQSDHINTHPYVLHMWRLKTGEFPVPPKEFV